MDASDRDIVIVTTKLALNEAVEAAVERAAARLAARLRVDAPGAGPKAWLTNRETQAYLGLSKATLARYRADGRLPFSRVGSSVFYRTSDIEDRLVDGMRRRGR